MGFNKVNTENFDFKGIILPKIKIAQNVLTLRPSKMWMSLFLHRNGFREILHYIICSPNGFSDSLQWKGAVRMRAQTADKSITKSTSNLHVSSPLMSCETLDV